MATKKQPTASQVKAAVAAYLEKHNGEGIKEDHDQDGITRLTDANGIILDIFPDLGCLVNGKPAPEIEVELRGYILEMAEDAPHAPNLPMSRSTGMRISSDANVPQGALQAVRECQATEKATYSTGKDRKAASAKTNIAALMEMGGSLEILDRTHSPDYIEYNVRAARGRNLITGESQHVDSSISIYKQEYLAKKAWEWIAKILMKQPGIVTGVDAYGMPQFGFDPATGKEAVIKVRISDEGESILVPLPATIALWREMAREWQSAGRVCETKAYSRAADMLLRGDFQSRDELKEEQSEVAAIKENAKAESA